MSASGERPEVSDEASPSTRPGPGGSSDEALLAAVAERGDRAAFVALFERYAGRVKGYLIRSGATEGVAEEVAQEVMVALWRRAASYDAARGSAATWIFTIARNRRIDLARRAARRGAGGDDPPIDPEPAASAEADLAAAARDSRVRAAIADLSPEQRDIVRFAFSDGLSHGEIAERTGLALGTVKSRLRLAFARLRRELGAGFVEELRDD